MRTLLVLDVTGTGNKIIYYGGVMEKYLFQWWVVYYGSKPVLTEQNNKLPLIYFVYSSMKICKFDGSFCSLNCRMLNRKMFCAYVITTHSAILMETYKAGEPLSF